MLCVIATMSVSATSCNKDDDEDDNGIVGTWRDTYEGEWDELTFKSDGTYTWTFYDEKDGNDIETGTYTYTHPILKLTYRDEDGEVWSDVYTIKSISSSQLEIDMEGDICIYKKR